jgi:TonB family protein
MTGIVNNRRAGIVMVLFALAQAGFATRAGGQETGEDSGPLLKVDLVRMMATTEYTQDELAHIVRMNCVTFRPTERDRRDLLALEGGERVLNEIARCREQGQAAGFSGGIPRATPIRSTNRAPTPDDGILRVATLSGDPLGQRPAPSAPRFTMVLVEKDRDALTVAEVPPRLENWDEVSEQLLREYRPNQRHAGTVVVRVRVDETGRAADSLLARSSGDPYLDAAVLATVPVMRFKPAMSRDRRVAAWTELPIAFETP